jgi:acyl-CoA thioester hydrolase
MRLHKTEIRVRYQETDNMGVVYYANYFAWFEVARTEYFRSEGISYRNIEEKGMYMMVAEASCRYKAPARYDDIVRIETWIPRVKNSSLDFAHKVYVGNKLIATGESVHVFTNKAGRPVRMPREVAGLSLAEKP